MAFFPDISILDQEGQPVVVAEAKSKLGTTPDWAASMRRNLAAHGPSFGKYFLLATPDRFYFWVNRGNDPERVLPDFAFEAGSALDPYYGRALVTPEDLGDSAFELMLGSWLSELASGSGEERLPDAARAWLKSSGFLSAIRGGRLEQR
jgi:hypothetical protein